MDALNNLVQLARNQSPFYALQFKAVDHVTRLRDLPITNRDGLWVTAQQNPRHILTEEHNDGFILRTGGTTSAAKLTCYSQIDWQRMTYLAGRGLLDAGLQAGDRMANLFSAGDLYGSFLLTVMSALTLPVPAITVPLGWALAPNVTRDRIEQCRTNVLLGPPTLLVNLALYCIQHSREFCVVTTIMFTGEPLFERQKCLLQQAFPNAKTIKSYFYGSVDAGLIGSSIACDDGHDHTLLKVFRNAAYLEIVTENDKQAAITENNVAGEVIVTNLSRQLQPVIRYPIGDRAEWVDFERGIFRLLGRSASTVRLGMASIDLLRLQHLLARLVPSSTAVQALIRQTPEGIDELEWVVAASGTEEEATSLAIVNLICEEAPRVSEQIEQGHLAPIKVRFAEMSDIRSDPSSGKVKVVLDLRFEV